MLESLETRWLLNARQMEALGRGVVAINRGGGNVYVGWRLLGTDRAEVAFNLYRATGGAAPVLLTKEPLTATTNFVDVGVNLQQTNAYSVRPVLDGVEGAASDAFLLPANAPAQQYLSVPLQVPPSGTTPAGENYTYNANDASVGDLDGDGEYEIILKWDPTNSKDNSQNGYTGNVYLDAYKLNGTRLWRIDLGRNIRAGAHYTQFLVYDLDGDGRAEIACKTADATISGTGQVIGNPNADHRNAAGRILTGPEFLTLFDGLTGAVLTSTNYLPARGTVSSWGDNYGNRVDRFLATVAYLDGERPSLVMARGYYTRSVLVAWNWRDGQLSRVWTFDSNTAGNSGYAGQGNHNLSVADVDADGKDEIIYGAAVINDNGTGLYTTRLGHGDALHVGDLDPDRPGLEVFDIHEPVHNAGAEFRDARTGQAIWVKPTVGSEGPGRGVSDDIWAGNRGAESWVAGGGISGLFNRYGMNIGRAPSSCNFLVWWDADPVRELLDGNHIDKYGPSSDTRLLTASGSSSNNGTKSTPTLSADLLGDWREEVIWRASDNRSLRIYTTVIPATSRLFTLMHDPQYRVAIAWQNVAYNQPPHPSFYLGDGMTPPPLPNIYLAGSISPWTAGDIGAVGVTGSTNLVNGTFTVRGSGADIWGTADAFRYVYQPLTGDGWIFAQVSSVGNTHAWAKAGVMLRESLEADSPYAALFVTPGNGVAMQRRINAGAASASTSLAGIAAPYGVYLERSGDDFFAWGTTDFVTWELIDSVTIPMAATIYLGLAVTSHNNAVLNTSTFDYVLTSVDGGGAPGGGGSGPGADPSGRDALALLAVSGVLPLAAPLKEWRLPLLDGTAPFVPGFTGSNEKSLPTQRADPVRREKRLDVEVDRLFGNAGLMGLWSVLNDVCTLKR